MNPFIARNLVYYPVKFLLGEVFPFEYWRYQKSAFWTREKIEAYQLQALKRLLRYAQQNVPYYRSMFKKIGFSPNSVQSLSDIAKLPTLTRDIIQEQGSAVRSTRKFFPLIKKITSGSTSKPLIIYKNTTSLCREDAALWRSLSWWGIHPSDRQVRFWGVPGGKLREIKLKLADFIMNRIRIPATVFDEETLLNYYRLVQKFRPTYFYGYPNVIERFARVLLRHHLDPSGLQLKAVVVTAEQLFPETRKLLETVFRTRVVVDYGTSEFGPIAYECPQGSLHLMSENLIVEIVDEKGKPVPPGEKGEIVVTDLHNYAMPFIRYRTGDLGRMSEEFCPCGKQQLLLKELIGRAVNLLRSTSGKDVHPTVPFYLVQDIARKTGRGFSFQLLQIAPKKIVVNIEKPSYDISRQIRMFLEGLVPYFGKDMEFEVRLLERIPREKSGKFMISKNLLKS